MIVVIATVSNIAVLVRRVVWLMVRLSAKRMPEKNQVSSSMYQDLRLVTNIIALKMTAKHHPRKARFESIY